MSDVDTSTLKIGAADLQARLNQLNMRAQGMERSYKRSEDIANGVAASMQSAAGTKFVQKIEIWQTAVRTCMAEYQDIISAVEATMNIMTVSADDAATVTDMWDGDVYTVLSK
ncbi:hypothetical protein [Streptomyces sp. NPDC094032]|uniref:hypothetical protein n=1 Tax=Streptomyces sp. NPDC094032 TaxID=3155308 RepID=UPI003318D2E4